MSLDAHPQLPDDSTPKRDDNHKIKRLPCCLFLENSKGRKLMKLNESSALVWSLCTGEYTVKEMIELLEESYPEAGDLIRKDVYRVLDEFLAEAVITVA